MGVGALGSWGLRFRVSGFVVLEFWGLRYSVLGFRV